MEHTAIYNLVTLAGMLLSRAALTDDQATARNTAMVAAKRSFRWVVA